MSLICSMFNSKSIFLGLQSTVATAVAEVLDGVGGAALKKVPLPTTGSRYSVQHVAIRRGLPTGLR